MDKKKETIDRAEQIAKYFIEYCNACLDTPFETYVGCGVAFLRMHCKLGFSRTEWRRLCAELLHCSDYAITKKDCTLEQWSLNEPGKVPVPFPQYWKENSQSNTQNTKQRRKSKKEPKSI